MAKKISFKVPEKLKSRKLWLALAGAVLVFANKYFEWGYSEEDLAKVLTMLGAYIFVEGGADLVSRLKK